MGPFDGLKSGLSLSKKHQRNNKNFGIFLVKMFWIYLRKNNWSQLTPFLCSPIYIISSARKPDSEARLHYFEMPKKSL